MLDITIKNYRCFPQSRPARLTIGPGVTAFLGVNNSGKSSLLRLFFELRNLFGYLSNANGNLLAALRGNPQGANLQGLLDSREIFPRRNTADAEISFGFHSDVRGERRPVILTVLLHRDNVAWTA